MSAPRTARDRARAELTREIKDAARRELAREGAGQLSLRAVARELEMVPSALYRYFPSRDDLLTALILEAYDALGERAEQAVAAVPGEDLRARWRAGCSAVRGWAIEHSSEYALLYGSPVPGYRAPQDTVAPATRVHTLLLRVVQDAQPDPGPALPRGLDDDAARLVAALDLTLPPAALLAAITAWSQLIGVISLELFGQLQGGPEPQPFFDHTVELMADLVGLPKDV